MFNNKSKLFKKRQNNIVTTKEMSIRYFQRFFSKIQKIEVRYKVNKTGDKANPCSTPILALKKGEVKLFQRYWVFLPTK